MSLFKKNQKYKVSRKSDFIQSVTLLDDNRMECNLAIDCTSVDCLENVLHRLEVKEIELFGLKYIDKSNRARWLDPCVPLKKYLDKFAVSHELYLGIFFYIDRAFALRDDSTRYQYYLQLKSDVLDGRLFCSLEQAILLASYALQAEYQNHKDIVQKEEYVREVEALLPQSLVTQYDNPEAISDITQHIISSHMALAGLSSTQAELYYIHLTQQMDGIGNEYITTSVGDSGEQVVICSAPSCITIRKPDGQLKTEYKRIQIVDITCNKKTLLINIATKKSSGKFLMESTEEAKYAQRILQLQQDFYSESHDYLILSDEELAMTLDTLPTNNGQANQDSLDIHSQFEHKHTSGVYESQVKYMEEMAPPFENEQADDDEYATMKFMQVENSPLSFNSVLYSSNQETGVIDHRTKESLHRSIQELNETELSPSVNSFLSSGINSMGVVTSSHPNPVSKASHAYSQDIYAEEGLPTYRPTPDYETVMRERTLFSQAYKPAQYAALSASQPDVTEPLYANVVSGQLIQHKSELHLYNVNPKPIPNNVPSKAHQQRINTPSSYATGPYSSTPDLMKVLYATPDVTHIHQAPDITRISKPAKETASPDLISSRTGYSRAHPQVSTESPNKHSQSVYKSSENLASCSPEADNRSIQSNRVSSRASSVRTISPRGSKRGGVMANLSLGQGYKSNFMTVDERLTGLEEKLNSNSIAAEYESLLKKRQPADCRLALRTENASRNRFPNVLPYEDSRVELIATASNPHGYINANHIHMKVGNERLTYIATQNPLADTVVDFWQMVWLHNVAIITMVTELEERGTQKCPRYWPTAAGNQNAMQFGDLKIVLKHTNASTCFTTSCLRVYRLNSKEHRTVWHIQYTDWHQTGCPKDVHGFLDLLNEIEVWRLNVQSEVGVVSPCILVHCSTGVGRSGVVILSDVMRKCLDNNVPISVASTLRELRHQRMYMVQTLAQYKFVHEVLIHYLKGGRLI